MIIALYGRRISEENLSLADELINTLASAGCALMAEQKLMQQFNASGLKTAGLTSFATHDELRGKADYLFSLGGDGTFLDTLTLVRDSGIPVMGINFGRLGFLASIGKDQMKEALSAFLKREFSLEQRTLLHIESNRKLFGDCACGLNDFTLHKKDASSMMVIHTRVNGTRLASYWADGLIIATPTGSTAYNLSCGGPILAPDSRNFVITPIAPHNLSLRPLVVSDDSEVTIEAEGRAEKFLANLDSRTETVNAGEVLVLKKETFMLSMVRLNSQSFHSTLRAKLNWGFDRRN